MSKVYYNFHSGRKLQEHPQIHPLNTPCALRLEVERGELAAVCFWHRRMGVDVRGYNASPSLARRVSLHLNLE
jgi:hypothetical protein